MSDDVLASLRLGFPGEYVDSSQKGVCKYIYLNMYKYTYIYIYIRSLDLHCDATLWVVAIYVVFCTF